ncbi:hypothetical protein LOC68_17450 [Blastopirellula sp. JC732]|uniref:Carboxypeptidase regulatory-like domain-containing protein n=1 Tax=Blastopirellula sediminis TaxID=2894196 RepID=A0A9X1MN07_9BACT|nr:hypothetical protein [Blastopirellula sediminis]MCC9606519.1 hypothetical protein [Blastopirellula sediminis]MCC9630183.1 hypothetical protein [Blastopirellula sediminis]
MRFHTSAQRAVAIALLAAACGACAPADNGPRRYRMQGEITYDGQPLPAGRISFAPDTEQGNSGPGGYADIVDGYYDTNNNGKGVVPGPHNVRIEGYDGQPSPKNDFYRYGTMVFRVHREQIEVPEKASTHNFDVPNPPNEK